MDIEKKLVLKIVPATWKNASRDMRELSVVKELGAAVIVMAKGDKTGDWDEVNGFQVYRMSSRPFGERIPNALNRIVSLFMWAHQARKFRADVISCHDLIALYIGWISTWFMGKKKRPKLVYDSHEFTIYDGNRGKIEEWTVTCLERFLIKKCAFVIEVNDKIADEVKRIHNLKNRPVAVRNVPEKWIVNSEICAMTRREIMKEFLVDDNCFLIMYHGAVVPARRIEVLLEEVIINSNVCLYVLGDGSDEYIEQLKMFCKENKIDGRVVFHEAVPHEELWKYVGAVDVGTIIVKAEWKSYSYSLPNKFFECIQAETPIICSNDLILIKELVEKYEIGLTCSPDSPEEINQCIEKLRLQPDLLMKFRNNIKSVKDEFCWEKEQLILKEAYGRIL